MQECIENLAEGIFEYSVPQIELSEKKLIISTKYGENKSTGFNIKTLDGKIVEGSVYASNYRLNCQTPQFCGREASIAFEFNSKGLIEGSVIEGDICIVSNAGEYRLPFVASVENTEPAIDENDFTGSLELLKPDSTVNNKDADDIISEAIYNHVDKEHIEYRKNVIELIATYCEFRLHKMPESIWARESLNIVSRILCIKQDDKWFLLIKAQLFIVRKQYQEAQWILDKFESDKELKTENEEMYGYFKYICTLIEKEPSYVKKIKQEIEELYKKNSKSWILLWILFYIDEKFENNSMEKYQYIERSIDSGCNNTLILVEAALLVLKEPLVLSRYGKTEKRILSFMYKNNCMNESAAMQFMSHIAREKVFDRMTYKICELCCELYPSKDNISSICSYLIRNDKYGLEYLKWYSRGIEEELRLAGLYEYFAMSVNVDNYDPLPKIVYMYFRYNSNINNKRRAYIYANLIKNKKQFPEIYKSYEKNVNEFMLSQLQKGIISLDMAVIYNEFLYSQMVTDDYLFSLVNIINSYSLKCNNENINKVTVHYKKLNIIKSYSIIRGQAYIQLCSNDYVLVFGDNDGNTMISGVDYELTKLINEEEYFLQCLKMSPSSIELAIYYFENEDKYKVSDYDRAVLLYNCIMSYDVKDEYKKELRRRLIDYYYYNDVDANFDIYIGNMLFDKIHVSDQARYIEVLLSRRIYEKAYHLIEEYGFENIKTEDLVVMCNYIIETNNFEKDSFLLHLAYYVFIQDKYNELIIKYLVNYYQGSIKEMNSILKAANVFNVGAHEFKERILAQMLYTKKYLKNSDTIFFEYCKEGAKEIMKKAYLSYFSYAYVVKQQLINNRIINFLAKEYSKESELNDVCKLALLKSWSEKEVLSDYEEVSVIELLDEFETKEMYFGFFLKFPRRIIEKYSFANKTIVEYYTDPINNIEINYVLNKGSYVIEPMKRMFEGIFVKDFQLFFGEKLQYYISETNSVSKQLVESGEIIKDELTEYDSGSAYQLLNDIMLSYNQQEEETLISLMRTYENKKSIVDKMFHKL